MLFRILPSLKAYDFQDHLVTPSVQVRKLPGKLDHIIPMSMHVHYSIPIGNLENVCVCTHIFLFEIFYLSDGMSKKAAHPHNSDCGKFHRLMLLFPS